MFFAYESHLTDKELAIMTDLLKYRVLTTKQIRDRYFDGKGRYVENVLLKLRKDEFIRSSTLKRSRKGKKGYSVHQLTETGKECLQRHDLSVEGQSSWNIYVNEHHIPSILLTNETLFKYESMGWSVLDSREVKHRYNLDYRSNIQGMLISPQGMKYGLYALETSISPNTVGRIQSEIARNQNIIENCMVIANGERSYRRFVNYAVGSRGQSKKKKDRLLTLGDLKIESYRVNYAKSRKYESKEAWIKKLSDHYHLKLKSTEVIEGERQTFPIIIEHQGQEKYFVDLTDSDINKLNDIELYNGTNSGYRWEKRKIIAVTLNIDTELNHRLQKLHSEGKIKLFVMGSDELSGLLT